MVRNIEPQSSQASGAEQLLVQAVAQYGRMAAALSSFSSELAALGSILSIPVTDAAIVAGRVDDAGDDAGSVTADTETIHVNLLGSFRMQVGTRNLNLNADMSGQVGMVLKYLFSQGRRPVSKETLMEMLWPEVNPGIASGRLRVLIHTVRKSVQSLHSMQPAFLPGQPPHFHKPEPQELIVAAGNSYKINPNVSLWVDVEEFEQRWLLASRLGRAGQLEDAVREYEQAAALYTGDYLEDEPYADWTLLRREALRDAYSTILAMLASISAEAGDYVGAIIWAHKLLALDNCCEDAYRVLMVSHERIGQPGKALHWYNLCVRTLDNELGMGPSAQTRQIYDRLMGCKALVAEG